MTNSPPSVSGPPANFSHDLRNTLGCIRQFGNILIDGLAGELSDEQREYVGIMLENASQIRRLLDSALEGNLSPIAESTNEIARVSKLEAL